MRRSTEVVENHRRQFAHVRRRNVPEDDNVLSENALREIEEGRADHAAGRTFTLAEIKKELKIASDAACTPTKSKS